MITYITSYTRKHTCLCILFIFLDYSIITVEMRDLNPEYLRNTRRCQLVELQGSVLLNLLDSACGVDVFLDILVTLVTTWMEELEDFFSKAHDIIWLAKMSEFLKWHLLALNWIVYVIANMCQCVIDSHVLFYVFASMTLGRFLLVFE